MKRSILFCSTVAALGLVACGSPDKALEDALKGAGNHEQKVINGPVLDGAWASDCVRNPLSSSGYRNFRLTVASGAFTHVEKDYSDSSCSREVDSKSIQGTVRYTKDLGDGMYQLEYRIPVNANVSALRNQNVTRINDDLKVTEFYLDFNGESDHTAPTIVLHRAANSGAQPAPKPAPAPAPGNAGPLKSGLYKADSSSACDISVSTMSVNGRVGAVYADFQSPCSAQSLEFDCSGTECRMSDSDVMTITLVDGVSFKLNLTESGKSLTYQKR